MTTEEVSICTVTVKMEDSGGGDVALAEAATDLATSDTSSALNRTEVGQRQLPDLHTVAAHCFINTSWDAAFELVIGWVYNETPAHPTGSAECKTYIQAYMLAEEIGALGLQDILLDCIRGYHKTNKVSFTDHVLYLVNRQGEDVDHGLIRYLVDQLAYNLICSSTEEYAAADGLFGGFLEGSNKGKLRRALICALAKMGGVLRSNDTLGQRGGSGKGVDTQPVKRLVDPAVAKEHGYYVKSREVINLD